MFMLKNKELADYIMDRLSNWRDICNIPMSWDMFFTIKRGYWAELMVMVLW